MDLLATPTKEVHLEIFPEEYDQQIDSVSDAKDRRQGKNPMCAAYVAKVNSRRNTLGISPLTKMVYLLIPKIGGYTHRSVGTVPCLVDQNVGKGGP